MKAVIIEEFGDLSQVKMSHIPITGPLPNEVQIEVSYAAINPVDWKIAAGLLRERMPYEFPITLGWDVAGKISKLGGEVSQFKVGDEVFAYARKSKIKEGTLAEYICLDESVITHRPKKLSLKEAAAIPLVGLTAWQALFEAAKIKSQETILIHAGAGGVGNLAIQLAKQYGAKVITTASVANHPYVKKLGADIAIDYHQENFVTKIKSSHPDGIDVVFDTIGGKTLEDSFTVIKPGGRLVTIIQQIPQDIAAKYKVHGSYVFVRPDGKQLKAIADLIDSGKIIVPEIQEYPLLKAKEALIELKSGHTKGKIVIKVK